MPLCCRHIAMSPSASPTTPRPPWSPPSAPGCRSRRWTMPWPPAASPRRDRPPRHPPQDAGASPRQGPAHARPVGPPGAHPAGRCGSRGHLRRPHPRRAVAGGRRPV